MSRCVLSLSTSNLGTLAELVKDNTRNSVHQTQQQLQALQSQFQLQNQGVSRQPQQVLCKALSLKFIFNGLDLLADPQCEEVILG